MGVEDCGGRACIDGVCAERSDAGPVAPRDGGDARDAGQGPPDASVADSGSSDAGANDAGTGDAGAVCAVVATGTLRGTVTDPSGRLGLPNVRVFVPTAALQPLPVGVTGACSGCESEVSGRPRAITVTSATGEFELRDVPAGRTDVVLQTGRWRRTLTVSVTACQTTTLAPRDAHLPRSRAEGHLPRIALVTGAADAFECLLLKMGVEVSEFGPPSAGTAVQLYVSNGAQLDGGLPPESDLFSDPATLASFDHVIAPCRGLARAPDPSWVQNLTATLDRGGRFFTTHYGYGWLSQGFPSAANWSPTNDFAAVDTVDVSSSFPKGAMYAEWLRRVAGVNSPITLVDPRYNVGAVNAGTIAWLGSPQRRRAADPVWTPQLTFTTPFGATTGCGRVAFSDFHVSAPPLDATFPQSCEPLLDFTAQEKLLVFILFDLATCARNDTEPPVACGALDTPCTARTTCCGALRCVDASLSSCRQPPCLCLP